MKKLNFFTLFLFAYMLTSAQSEVSRYSLGITPMHKFFQQYADSTIIIEYSNIPDGKPSYYTIISKSNRFVNTFKYEPIDTAYYPVYRLKKTFPVILWNVLGMKLNSFKNRPADINIFFKIVSIPPDTAKKMWQDIAKFQPWQPVDDSDFGYGCKMIEDRGISHNPPSVIHLITKKEIKTLIFESPYYFEYKLCPGNKNRQGISAIMQIFHEKIPLRFDNY